MADTLRPMLDPRAIHIYTDGSCYKNPGGKSGCAAIVHFPDHLNRVDDPISDFGCAESSNNRMELMACVEALNWVCRHARCDGVTRIQIVTDSQYITDNIARAQGWKKMGWRNIHGEWKSNSDLWNKVLALRVRVARCGIRVDFIWQKGKKTDLGKQVDRAAKDAAKRGGMDVDAGYKPGSVTRSKVKGGSAERFPADGQVLVIRPYTKKPMHGRDADNRISFNIFDEAANTYIGKFYAFANSALSFELHNGNGHRVRFNSNPNFPQLLERIEGVDLPKPERRKKQDGSRGDLPEIPASSG